MGLILFPKSKADSEITRPNISKFFTVSKTSTYGMLIPKYFSSEISAIIEISINSALHTIIEYQIFCVISPIVETNLGKIYFGFYFQCNKHNVYSQCHIYSIIFILRGRFLVIWIVVPISNGLWNKTFITITISISLQCPHEASLNQSICTGFLTSAIPILFFWASHPLK